MRALQYRRFGGRPEIVDIERRSRLRGTVELSAKMSQPLRLLGTMLNVGCWMLAVGVGASGGCRQRAPHHPLGH